MEEPNYTKRELDHHLTEIKDSLHDMSKNQSMAHEQMITQLRITNGRVKSLELWRSYLLGGLTIISILVVPVFLWVLKDFFT